MNEELELPKPFCVVRLDRIGGAADVAEDEQDAEMWVHGCEDVYTAEQVRELVRAAKEQERERCAQVAESDDFYGGVTQHLIAEAIRKGGEE